MLSYLFFVATQVAATSLGSTLLTNTFYQTSSPGFGPIRLDAGWTTRSLVDCVSTCMDRYTSDCWSVMYNRTTGHCTPGRWLNASEAAPSSEEGDLYLGYTCDFTPDFTVYANYNTPACLTYVKKKKNYWKAQSYCQTLDSHLFVSKTLEKFQILRQIVTDSSWIGLDDWQVEGVFEWITDKDKIDSSLMRAIFLQGNPNNGNHTSKSHNEDCVVVTSNIDWQANDVGCIADHFFVCEKPMSETARP